MDFDRYSKPRSTPRDLVEAPQGKSDSNRLANKRRRRGSRNDTQPTWVDSTTTPDQSGSKKSIRIVRLKNCFKHAIRMLMMQIRDLKRNKILRPRATLAVSMIGLTTQNPRSTNLGTRAPRSRLLLQTQQRNLEDEAPRLRSWQSVNTGGYCSGPSYPRLQKKTLVPGLKGFRCKRAL